MPVNLFCVPYAGGSAQMIYSKWSTQTDGSIRVKPLEIAGHGNRLREPLPKSMAEIAADLFNAIRLEISGKDYCFFSHSMGCCVVFELLKIIKAHKLREPLIWFLSGHRPLDREFAKKKVEHLSDDELIKYLESIGSTYASAFQSREIRDLFLPIIRNDFQLYYHYPQASSAEKVANRIHVFVSKNDSLAPEDEMHAWSRFSEHGMGVTELGEGHFYLHQEYPEICRIISEQVQEEAARTEYASVFA